MSKAISYYDWELGLKKKIHSEDDPIRKEEETTKIGIPKSTFKSFLSEWKKNNL